MWDVILDALIDSAKVLPFLFIIYILIEFLERNSVARNKVINLLNGKLAPVVASAVGIVPQCGFSVMSADLFSQGFIRTGTLIAVLIATSDEALPILLTNADTVGMVWILLVVKVVTAILFGYVINAFDKRTLTTEFSVEDEGCCHHDIDGKQGFWHFIEHPVIHTLKIFAYLFVVNAVFGLLLMWTEGGIASFMNSLGFFQPFFASVVGLIPNCGSSVVLVGLYTEGIINFGSMCAGLVANSGIAVAVLLRNNFKKNVVIVAVLYGIAVVVGMVMMLLPL